MTENAWMLIYLALYVIALGLIILELFLPTGGILGAAATVAILYCLYGLFSVEQDVLAYLLMIFTVGYVVWALRFGVRRLAHNDTLADGVSTGADVKQASQLIGREGVTLTPLHPAGVARIDGRRYDVVTSGAFVESGVTVSVVDTSGNRIVVRASGTTAAGSTTTTPFA